MRPEFDTRGVKILTVSTDTPDELAKGRPQHQLGATMLSDRKLDVTDRASAAVKGLKFGLINV